MEEQTMRFVDDEFLLLSRGGRLNPGTNARLGSAQTAREQAIRELVADAAVRRKPLSARFSALLTGAAASLTGVLGGARRSDYGSER
jgi:hypothetical protein